MLRLINRERLVFASLWIFWIGVALVILINTIPDTALRFSSVARVTTKLLAPAGWGFFTRDPQEPKIYAYAYDLESGQYQPSNAPDVRGPGIFGIDRSSRVLNIEIGAIESLVPPQAWMACEGDPADCIATTRARTVLNPMHDPQLCGRIGFARMKPTPWAWSRSGRAVHMPSHTTLLRLECPEV